MGNDLTREEKRIAEIMATAGLDFNLEYDQGWHDVFSELYHLSIGRNAFIGHLYRSQQATQHNDDIQWPAEEN